MSKKPTLELSFHGRIIDHLGIQMYQSAVAAIAEMVSNAWDADAEEVKIIFPEKIDENSEIAIVDNGHGMTFDDCQKKFLKVGLNRRGDKSEAKSLEKSRPVLGRKGIGKLAGFGIARKIEILTVSKSDGERTRFCLDLDELRGTDYIGENPKLISVLEYSPPDKSKIKDHGTTITLKNLVIKKQPDKFSSKMARRFLLPQTSADFKVFVNGEPLPQEATDKEVEFIFPRDLPKDTDRECVIEKDGWASEILPSGDIVKWRVNFFAKPISEDELRGISIFANGKIAQTPFNFNLTGGLVSQHGLEYMSGQVQADFIDKFAEDIIAPERQRINWENPEAEPLLLWGQKLVKDLLSLWKKARAEKKEKILDDKVGGNFSERLDNLEPTERSTVKQALSKLASIESIDDDQFALLGESLLTAWEDGRLKALISKVSEIDEMQESDLLAILVEAKVLNALHTAEAVKTKLSVIAGLQERIERKDLENSVRDYIAKNAWLIGPRWETFAVETSLKKTLEKWAAEVEKDLGKDKNKRIDLALSSGDHLLVVEFMQPGLPLDRDHIQRFETYIHTIEASLNANTGGRFNRVSGYIIADKIDKKPANNIKIKAMAKNEMYAMDWNTLLNEAFANWHDFLGVLSERVPDDVRMKRLLEKI